MNISLTPELEELVNEKVKSGQYQSASEVIGVGLRLLEERDRLNQLPDIVDIVGCVSDSVTHQITFI